MIETIVEIRIEMDGLMIGKKIKENKNEQQMIEMIDQIRIEMDQNI